MRPGGDGRDLGRDHALCIRTRRRRRGRSRRRTSRASVRGCGRAARAGGACPGPSTRPSSRSVEGVVLGDRPAALDRCRYQSRERVAAARHVGRGGERAVDVAGRPDQRISARSDSRDAQNRRPRLRTRPRPAPTASSACARVPGDDHRDRLSGVPDLTVSEHRMGLGFGEPPRPGRLDREAGDPAEIDRGEHPHQTLRAVREPRSR